MIDLPTGIRQGCSVAAFACWTSFCLACLEIEIEGAHGWALNLPTWRRRSVCCGSRPLTGYHTSLALTMISMSVLGAFTGAVVLGDANGGANVLLCLSIFVLIMALEDSYWYVLNYMFHAAVKRGEAQDHFELATRLKMYGTLLVISFVLWLLGFVAIDNASQGGTAYGFVLLTLVILELVVRSVLRPLHQSIRQQLEGLPVQRMWWFLPLAIAFSTVLTVELVLLAVGMWSVADLVVSRLE